MVSSRIRTALCVMVAAAIASLLAACGSTVDVGSSRTLTVALDEYRINPQNATVPAGRLTIIVHNYGRLTHNLRIERDGRPAGGTQPIWPGRTATLTLYLVKGSYTMSSGILSDQALGEYGTLTVP
jgi:hypothetical protein